MEIRGDGVRVNGVRVDHEKKSDGVRVHHERKSDGVMVKRSDGVKFTMSNMRKRAMG